MPNNPFDRTILRPLEKPLADDINQAETNFDHALRFFIAALLKSGFSNALIDGFLSDGLAVVPASPVGMSVSVSPGLGFQRITSTELGIDSVVGLNDLEQYKPIPLRATQAFTVPTAPVAPNTRIDIIEVQAQRIVTDSSSRQVFDEGLGQFLPDTVDKTLQWALDGRAAIITTPVVSTAPFGYKIGIAGNPGVVPPTSPGYIKIAEIAVGSDVTEITTADITDFRELLTEQIVKVHFPASDGFLSSGTATPQPGGFVNVNAASGWEINIGAGLEAGDIIEDIIVVVERLVGASNDLQTNFNISEMDLDTPAVNVNLKSLSNTGVVSPLGIYEIHHKLPTLPFPQSGNYPFTWTAGSSATMLVVSDSQNDRVYGCFAIVRRPINKRDN